MLDPIDILYKSIFCKLIIFNICLLKETIEPDLNKNPLYPFIKNSEAAPHLSEQIKGKPAAENSCITTPQG